jgi:hypothetical protein
VSLSGFLLIFIALIALIGFLVKSHKERVARELQENLTAIPDFASDFFEDVGACILAVDDGHQLLAIVYRKQHHVFAFSKLLTVQYWETTTATTETHTNRGSQVFGAAVGAALVGPVGMLLGGLTGSTRSQTSVHVTGFGLALSVDDIFTPVFSLTFRNVTQLQRWNLILSKAIQNGRLQTSTAYNVITVGNEKPVQANDPKELAMLGNPDAVDWSDWNTDARQQLADNNDGLVWVRLAAEAIEKVFSWEADFCSFKSDDDEIAVQFAGMEGGKVVCQTAADAKYYTAQSNAYLRLLGFHPDPSFRECFQKFYSVKATNFEELANLVLQIFDRAFGINKFQSIGISVYE